jgi:hypothetical protein
MNLIYLHGPPAAGKLTIARELLRVIPGRLLDNHASIDFGRTLFEFGSPEFWQFVHQLRLVAVQHAVLSDIPNLIYTSCYSDPDDRPHFEELQGTLAANQGRLIPAYLFADTNTLNQRVSNPDRLERRKLTSLEGLASALATWNIAPVPHGDCMHINTASQSAVESAALIIEHFGLAMSGDTQ